MRNIENNKGMMMAIWRMFNLPDWIFEVVEFILATVRLFALTEFCATAQLLDKRIAYLFVVLRNCLWAVRVMSYLEASEERNIPLG